MNQKIAELQKIDIEYYRTQRKDDIEEEPTIDDSINKFLKIKEIENDKTKFELEF